MESQSNKRLSDVTREASSKKVNKFAESLMPAAPKPKPEPVQQELVAEADPALLTPVPPVTESLQALPAPVPTKPDRARKSGGLVLEEIISASARDGDVFNKMVRVTDDHHELLRLMAFKYRKPMNVIVHNLLALLDQAYQKEQKGGQGDV